MCFLWISRCKEENIQLECKIHSSKNNWNWTYEILEEYSTQIQTRFPRGRSSSKTKKEGCIFVTFSFRYLRRSRPGCWNHARSSSSKHCLYHPQCRDSFVGPAWTDTDRTTKSWRVHSWGIFELQHWVYPFLQKVRQCTKLWGCGAYSPDFRGQLESKHHDLRHGRKFEWWLRH